ncbi:hypothetical protein DJ568_07780 [Mucilaginibacter hurinus]|uniref:DUF4468 domain-containing protein n=1 Tax=Mucilaginibacter hurinus TaxID=2201324 RepID=A0A367GQU2_9SPHI|nr:DUF4468 domain-containing protein [Mucilaginibacter hurinus]RCH55083.1 hypothetical protein DJ568_07780 [Mucilaginibacter hurinus]
MKEIVLTLMFAFGVALAHAQTTDSLSFDENDKYIYYQVASEPSVNTDTLYNRALHFLKTAYPSDQLKLNKENKSKLSLTGTGGFMVRKKALVSLQPNAKIEFDLTIEVKGDKYRYWLTNFVVVPYQRDRYANYVPVSGKKIPLEHGYRKLGQKDTDDYIDKLLMNCRWVGAKLKSYMAKTSGLSPAETKLKKIITKEW